MDNLNDATKFMADTLYKNVEKHIKETMNLSLTLCLAIDISVSSVGPIETVNLIRKQVTIYKKSLTSKFGLTGKELQVFNDMIDNEVNYLLKVKGLL